MTLAPDAVRTMFDRIAPVYDVVDFVVGRILDQLGVDNALMPRWGQSA